jgi:hypothetical protein
VHLHLAQVAGLDPAANLCSLYLYVDDADALHGQWSEAGVRGRLIPPVAYHPAVTPPASAATRP